MSPNESSEPKVGDLLPEEWDPWILEWKKWDEEGVPKDAQDYVHREGKGSRFEQRILSIGRHPDGRYFLAEVVDQGNSPDYFAGWWSDVKKMPALPPPNKRLPGSIV